jgi:hypothetical protein
VAVTEMPDASEPTDAAGCRLVYATPLDRVDAMRPPRWRAPLRPVVAHRHVDALVVDRAAATVGSRIEERAADRMLALEREHRPSFPSVVVALERLKPAWSALRHSDDLSGKPSPEPPPKGERDARSGSRAIFHHVVA